MQTPPLNRLTLVVQQIHQKGGVPLGAHTQKRDRAEAAQPFFKLGVWLLEKHKAKEFPRLWSPAFFFEPFLESMCDLEHSLQRQTQQHLSHQAVSRPVGLVLRHFPTCAKNLVDCDQHTPALECGQAVSTASLVTNPFQHVSILAS